MTTLRPCGHLIPPIRTISTLHLRAYAQKASPPRITATQSVQVDCPPDDYAKAAFRILSSDLSHDPINPPLSTRPPPLNLPVREKSSNVFYYYFHIGRAYARFYKDGVKAVWYNRKAAGLLRERTNQSGGNLSELVKGNKITRAEFQLRRRDGYDIGKLPFFGLLVVVFGEWLPLFVPFMPNAVPGTCRIPKQVDGMRKAVEERRRMAYRTAVNVPSEEQMQELEGRARDVKGAWPVAYDPNYRKALLNMLRDEQTHHLSVTLDLHGRFWDVVGFLPKMLIRSRLDRKLSVLSMDDILLLRHQQPAQKLGSDELKLACEERGIDVLGRSDEHLRQNLADWLARQKEDAGRGVALMGMLFRRCVTILHDES
jgi:hypothetical protein